MFDTVTRKLSAQVSRFRAATNLVNSHRLHLGEFAYVLGRRHPKRLLVCGPSLLGTERWTGEALDKTVGMLAASFRHAGVRKGQIILVATGNRVDLLLHILALARIGALPAPMSYHVKPGELTVLVESTGAEGAVCDQNLATQLREALGAGAPVIVADGAHEDGFDLLSFLQWNPAPLLPVVSGDASSIALYLCTSGTTGVPKAAALTSEGLLGPHRLLSALPLGNRRGPRHGRDALFSALPLAHVMGLAVALGTLHAGIRWIHRERFDAEEALDVIEQDRPNVFIGVPTMFADMEAKGAADRDLSSIQVWGSGADAMPLDRAQRYQGYGSTVRFFRKGVGTAAFADLYGMVELSGPAAVRILPFAIDKRLSVPMPHVLLPGMEVRSVDAEGNVLGWGRHGELQFRGPGVLRHYKNNEKAGPDGDGWFSSGDYGKVWPGGQLFSFAGRSKDRLKVNGFSVFPAEVEAQLDGFPGVSEVCLVGVPDTRMGERPVALLVVTEDVDVDAWLDWARKQVTGYRRPRAAQIVDGIPRGKHDKIDRNGATALAHAD